MIRTEAVTIGTKDSPGASVESSRLLGVISTEEAGSDVSERPAVTPAPTSKDVSGWFPKFELATTTDELRKG